MGNKDEGGDRYTARRLGSWLAAVALVVLVPLVAMQFTDEVKWTVSDFVFAACLVGGVGLAYELAARRTGDGVYRAAVGVALAGAFVLIWANGAVGIIGSEDNPANLMYGGVLAVGVAGVLVARFEPSGMARALTATAVAQGLVVVIALVYDLGAPWSGAGEIVLINGFFIALWLIAAELFRKAARVRTAEDRERGG